MSRTCYRLDDLMPHAFPVDDMNLATMGHRKLLQSIAGNAMSVSQYSQVSQVTRAGADDDEDEYEEEEEEEEEDLELKKGHCT
ncbi:hypothetical protein AK812_SmicGene17393 [Symbiodinium microadriaticum]|uniref:Uncharacterized protein n=1 Tax=Symbiodinium microadriaticum TaxID=2951 RepID=A0A1Q9DXX0_SYMMI|nr:hypothetical protein AK812_SmicGene17393 [Symbiodinium microadriaticum]